MTDPTELNRSFPVSGVARLTLRNVEGAIDIAAGEAEVISVQAIKQPGPGANETEIEISQSPDGRVSVITHYQEDLIARLFHPRHHGPARVDYTVRLPPACEVDVAFVSGQARLQGLRGQLLLRSVSGPMDLLDLAGHLKINTVSGLVTAAHTRLEGELELQTVSADAVFADSFVPAIHANSVSGKVQLQTELGPGPYHFRSVSGDVWLAVPAITGCHVDMHALSGRLRANWPATRHAVGGGWTSVEFGADGSGPEVRFDSVSGDLHLVTPGEMAEAGPVPDADEAPTSAASPAAPPAAAADHLATLERLARGELTVDQAVHDLKT